MPSYSKYQNKYRKNINNQDQTKRPKRMLNKKQRDEEFIERVIEWITFYRRNLHRFAEHYLRLELYLYQKILLYFMNLCPLIVIVACRASAKSFLIAVFACCRCILYPGSRVVIASNTKKQAKLIVTEKIEKELRPNSPTLDREIKKVNQSNENIEVIFHNGSSIVVVAASESSRGYRSTVLILEEFRQIDKKIIDSVLSPFSFVRQVPYLKKTEYEHLKEEPMEIYISSSWFKQHWMWSLMKLGIHQMFNYKDAILIGFDYAITLKHGIRTRKQLEKEKKKLGATTFAMEYENLMLGETENAYFTYDMLNKNRKIKKAFYPRKHIDVIEKKKNSFDIKKLPREIRIVTVDVSMVSGKDNDNTSIDCIRALQNGDSYERQVVYIETMNGGNTFDQAIRIKQIFYDFDADYLVLDTYNAGISLFDVLGRVLYDEERDMEYEPWTSFNDDNAAERIKNTNAKQVIYSIKASAQFNHEMHMMMRDCLERGKLKLLIQSNEAEDLMDKKKQYATASVEEKVMFDMPFVQTDVLINEMVNLSYETKDSSQTIKLIEPKNARKDRYTSLAYGNYFIQMLERDLQEEEETVNWDNICNLFN